MKLQIQGFQSHRDATIDIGAGVNAIVGISGTGKSAILRAIDWVINNQPSGDDFLPNSYKFDECKVTLSDDKEGWAVSRVKSKTKNQYILYQRRKKEQVFEGFGREVPAPIKSIINIQDFNLRFQHQSPFLMNESSGAVSRYFNKIARLDLIDKATSNIESQLKKEKATQSIEESLLVKANDQLKRFETLPDVELHLSELESLNGEIKADTAKYNGILDLCELTKGILIEKNEVQKTLKLKPQLGVVLDLQDEIENDQKKYKALDQLYNDGIFISADILRLESITSRRDRVLSLMIAQKEIQELKTRRTILEMLICDTNRHQDLLAKTKQELIKLQKEYVLAFPAKCPLCGRGAK